MQLVPRNAGSMLFSIAEATQSADHGIFLGSLDFTHDLPPNLIRKFPFFTMCIFLLFLLHVAALPQHNTTKDLITAYYMLPFVRI